MLERTFSLYDYCTRGRSVEVPLFLDFICIKVLKFIKKKLLEFHFFCLVSQKKESARGILGTLKEKVWLGLISV